MTKGDVLKVLRSRSSAQGRAWDYFRTGDYRIANQRRPARVVLAFLGVLPVGLSLQPIAAALIKEGAGSRPVCRNP